VQVVGENRAQDLERKHAEYGDAFRWHFIGHLQSNKVKVVNGICELVHSLDSESAARRLTVPALLEVNLSGEPTKSGVAPDDIRGWLERFPTLRIGIIEQGASWLPGWMRNMDSAHRAFAKNEERLQRLRLLPSEYVRRQVRVTPYPHEDTGWIIANSGDEVCLFSSDYPHVEGGRNPLARFAASTAGLPAPTMQRFYCDNFVDLMGRALNELT